MTTPVVHTEFNPPPDLDALDCSQDPGVTKQSFKEDCDINVIMERYVPSEVGSVPPMFGDFTEAPDFMAAQAILLDAQEKFGALPSKVRERFANDPARFLEFVNDPANSDEAIALGLATKRPEVKKEEPPAPPPVPPKV